MPSPVTAADFQPQEPNAPLCDIIKQKLLNNAKIAQLLAYLFDDDGNTSAAFLGGFSPFLPKPGYTRWAPFSEDGLNPTDGPVWVEYNGSSLVQADYPRLFAYLGTKFNKAGDDNAAVFRTPNVSGRVLLMRGDSVTEGSTNHGTGETGGEEGHKLIADENGPHSHKVQDLGSLCSVTSTTRFGGLPVGDDPNFDAPYCPVTNEQGKGTAHNNMPPYFAGVLYCLAGYRVGGAWI